MSHDRLLILAPSLGLVSETFILRHCSDLASGPAIGTFHNVNCPPTVDPDSVVQLPEPPVPHPGIRARVVDRLRPRERRHAHRGTRLLSETAIDMILTHSRRTGSTVALLEYLDRWTNAIPKLKDHGLRVVVHGHGYDLSSAMRNPATKAMYQRYLPSADAVVVPSDFARDRLADFGLRNVEVVPYGVPPAAASSHPRHSSPVRAVAVGRLVPKKDPIGLLAVVAGAVAAGADVRLDVFGDGPLRPAVERAITSLALGDFVHLHGAQPNPVVRDVLRSADIFVQKSVTALGGDEEGLPVAILEAMAAGLPVLSTRHAGIPEAVVDDVTGLLFEEDDVHGLAAGLARYVKDPALRERHGAAGRARSGARFTWETNRSELRRVLQLDG